MPSKLHLEVLGNSGVRRRRRTLSSLTFVIAGISARSSPLITAYR